MKGLNKIAALLIVSLSFYGCDNDENLNPDSAEIFVKYYGDEGNHEAVDVEWVEDGYYLIGNRQPTGKKWGIHIIKADFFGNYIEEIRPATTSQDVKAMDAAINAQGNLVVVSKITSEEGISSIHIAEYTAGSDDAVNEVHFPDTPSTGNYVPESITVLNNGEIIVTGHTDQVDVNKANSTADPSDFLSLKFNGQLDLAPENEWRRLYGQSQADRGHKVIETYGGEFVFFGSGAFTNDPDNIANQSLFTFLAQENGFVVSSFNAFGTLNDDLGSDIARTDDGGFVILGNLNIAGNSPQPMVVRMDANNNPGVNQALQITSVEAKSIIEGVNGGYIITGSAFSSLGRDVYVAQVNNAMEVLWENRFGYFNENYGHRAIQTPEGAVLIFGTINLESQTKMCLIKANPQGALIP